MRPLGLGCGKAEVDGLLVRRNLDALDLLQFLDAALHLLGLGRLGAKAVDEGLELLDALALVLVGGDQRVAALLLLRQILLVVAAVEVDALVPDLDDAIDGDVEKVAVVRDQHVGEGILQQIFFQPVAGFEIEMVGGLVEQQQVRLRQQQLGQRNAHLPAAGELFGVARPVFLAEAQAVEHRAHLRVERVAVVHAEVAGDSLVAVGHLFVFARRRIELAHLVGEVFHLLLHRSQVAEHGHALVEDGAAFEAQAILRQIAEGRVLGGGNASRSRATRCRRGPSAAWTCRCRSRRPARPIVRRDEPVKIFEQQLGAEAFSGRGELDHGLFDYAETSA